jgi:hypothetical protein
MNQDLDQVVERTRQWNIVQDAVCAIREIENSQDLNLVIEALKQQRAYLARRTTRSLQQGDTVEFTGRDGSTVTGTVLKVNRKTVIVQEGRTKWRVAATLLRQVEAA